MKVQNYKNHRQFVPVFHIVTLGLLLALFVGSIVNLIHTDHSNLYSASLICLGSVVMMLLYIFIRSFPLKAQDRAIRAEQNLRHFSLTGKLLDERLTLGQVIALRFASDDEFITLAKKAAEENINGDAIKKLIIDWKGDHHRV